MTKLKSGYYSYTKNRGITFLDTHLYIHDMDEHAVFVSPSGFHQIVQLHDDLNTLEPAVAYFKYNDELLADLHYGYDIGGLYEI